MPTLARILIVHSVGSARELLELFLKKEGFHVTSVSSAEQGLAQVNCSVFDLIIAKFGMPDMSGLDLLRELQNTSFKGQFILLTSSSVDQVGLHALKMGAYAYVLTTENFMEELKLIINRALQPNTEKIRGRASGLSSKIRQTIRFVIAVVVGSVTGEVVSIPLAFVLDLGFGGDVTGGRWPFTSPNLLLTILKGFVTGYVAGYVAKQRGKLAGALAVFLPLTLTIGLSIIRNVDLSSYYASNYDTHPALWSWIALAPALIGGWLGQQRRRETIHSGASPQPWTAMM